MVNEQLDLAARSLRRSKQLWWKLLLLGGGAYLILLLALLLTQNPNIFPALVLIGSFLVPISYVMFFYARRGLSRVDVSATLLSFVWGGILGIILASILEPILVQNLNIVTVFILAGIEEFAKIAGVLVVARHRRHNMEVSGVIIGAAAGMGFAGLESMGYTFVAFVSSRGSISAAVGVTLLRGILSPLGHGTWTAILASVLFRESRPGHYRINLKVIGAYLMVVLFHGLWDSVPPLLAAVTPSGVATFVGEAIVGAMGLFVLWRRWREAKRLSAVELAAGEPVATLEQPTPIAADASNQ
jgi:protease PrsW